MKRWQLAIVVVFSLFLTSGIVSAACTPSGQTMFKISDTTNAHAENRTESNYGTDICFNNYFQADYSGADRYSCNGAGTRVINLSSVTNAHVEDPLGTNYDVGVCYGDLTCELRTNVQGCNGFGSRIVYLSDTTNAHVALAPSSYPYVLCCDSAVGAICNYNTICEPGNGETIQNCIDCEIPNPCADGGIVPPEVCDYGIDNTPRTDDDNRNGETCMTQGFDSGTLYCDTDCEQFDTSGCAMDGEDLDFCDNYTGSGLDPPVDLIYFNLTMPTEKIIETCEEYTNLEDTDFDQGPESFPRTEEDFRREMCGEDCGRVAVDHPGASLGSSNRRCVWDSDIDRCLFEETTESGAVCIYEWITTGLCQPGDTHRTIEVNSTKVGGSGSCPEDGERIVPCPRSIQLPFFGMASMILSLIAIGVIYFLYPKKKK